jgi:hypothetical protein
VFSVQDTLALAGEAGSALGGLAIIVQICRSARFREWLKRLGAGTEGLFTRGARHQAGARRKDESGSAWHNARQLMLGFVLSLIASTIPYLLGRSAVVVVPSTSKPPGTQGSQSGTPSGADSSSTSSSDSGTPNISLRFTTDFLSLYPGQCLSLDTGDVTNCQGKEHLQFPRPLPGEAARLEPINGSTLSDQGPMSTYDYAHILASNLVGFSYGSGLLNDVVLGDVFAVKMSKSDVAKCQTLAGNPGRVDLRCTTYQMSTGRGGSSSSSVPPPRAGSNFVTVFSADFLSLYPGQCVSLDTGTVSNCGGKEHVLFPRPLNGEAPIFEALNGAAIHHVGQLGLADFAGLDGATLAGYDYDATVLDNQLTVGTVLGWKTGQGIFAKCQLLSVDPGRLDFRLVVYRVSGG